MMKRKTWIGTETTLDYSRKMVSVWDYEMISSIEMENKGRKEAA